jgi:hypothetical protein
MAIGGRNDDRGPEEKIQATQAELQTTQAELEACEMSTILSG